MEDGCHTRDLCCAQFLSVFVVIELGKTGDDLSLTFNQVVFVP